MPTRRYPRQVEPRDNPVPVTKRTRVRRRYQFGSSGVVYVFVTLLIALGAFNSQNNLLFWAFGFSLSLLIVSGVLSGGMLMGLSVTRERIGDAHSGGVLTIRYRVRNANRIIPVFGLTIEESSDMTSAADGGMSNRRFGRGGREQRRAASAAIWSRIEPPRTFVAHVGPRQSLIAEARVNARARGPVAFASFAVHMSFPFGIMRKSIEVLEPANTIVLPALARVETALLNEHELEGESDRSSRRRGQGDEFHSLRDYTAGDSPKLIAWRASARRGHLLVRQSLAPAPLRLWLVLRLRISSTDTDLRDEQAISVAAALIEHARARSIALGLAIPLTGLSVPPRSDPAHMDRLMRELGQLDLGAVDQRGAVLPFPLAAASHRHACLCIHAGAVDPSYGPGDRSRHIGAQLDSVPRSIRAPGLSRATDSVIANPAAGAPA
ncbi:MAG: DUF58 domain-containing protein [Phycisphaerales bacterium]